MAYNQRDTVLDPNQSNLIKAFRDLIEARIPCMWRVSPHSNNYPENSRSPNAMEDKEELLLELWVFWFDDRHTKVVDRNPHLGTLEGMSW